MNLNSRYSSVTRRSGYIVSSLPALSSGIETVSGRLVFLFYFAGFICGPRSIAVVCSLFTQCLINLYLSRPYDEKFFVRIALGKSTSLQNLIAQREQGTPQT